MGFDLKKQLVFYGAYHRDPTNVKIHMVFVPILLATGFLFGTTTPSLPTPRLLSRLHLPLNLCTLAATTYSSLYILLSPNFAGLSLTPLLLSTAALANKLHLQHGAKAIKIGLGVHVVSWIVQFIGHGKYEGRKPALLDNLVQALFLAPLFVWYEWLFGVGGYKQLNEEVKGLIEEEVRRIKAKEGKKA